MLIAVFGDIHGNLPALEAVIADGKNLGVDAWVCLGDVAFRGPQPVECVETVAGLPGIVQIVGNTDQWLFQGFPNGFSLPEERMQLLVLFREWTLPRLQPWHLERLQNAPFSHTLMLNDHEVLFFHSSPSSTESWLPSSFSEDELVPLVTNHTADVVVYGHIHTPFIRQVGGRTVINTGSVGHPTDGDNRASYLLLESKEGMTSFQLRRVPYKWPDTVARAHEVGMPAADAYARALEYGNAL
ncbi:MAG: metallophosphoesterase family protein [Limnochordia bacterium]